MDTSEHGFEILIGNLLRAGVFSAAGVVLVGGVWLLSSPGAPSVLYSVFRGEPRELSTVRGIAAGVLSGDSRALIQMGLLLLIATPIARVILSLVAFALHKDMVYVLITTIVLVGLIFSFVGG